MQFEIRKIDAIEIEDEWKWVGSYSMGQFETNAYDQKRAFLRALHKLGIVCKRGRMGVVIKGNTYTLKDRRTGKPIYAALPMEKAREAKV